MVFKIEWEKTNERHSIPIETIEAMVSMAFPHNTLKAHHIIAGGCANLNVHILLKEGSTPFILRIYLRDPTRAFIEKAIGDSLENILPTPKTLFVGTYESFTFSVMEFIEGVPLREALLEHNCPIEPIMKQAGHMFAKIQNIHFAHSGFFEETLVPQKPLKREAYEEFLEETLKSPNIHGSLKPAHIQEIKGVFDKNFLLLPNEEESFLVHEDFDPANILVKEQDGDWTIRGLLNWEFAFSGSPLHDVANMLRYAHEMPPIYEKAFLLGAQVGAFTFPPHWRETTHLLNLLALLDSLQRHPPEQKPKQVTDILNLIDHILLSLNAS